MNTYQQWKFKDNPFSTMALSPDDVGNDLIAGRDEEINKFLKRLYNPPQIVTVEGDNGIGKTSLINVAIFRATLNYITNKRHPNIDNPLFLPCIKTFQLELEIGHDTFLRVVFTQIAQTIIKYQDNFKKLGLKLPSDLNEVDQWINRPYNKSYQANIGFPAFQIGGGTTTETNTSLGFEKTGLQEKVINWLKTVFPQKNSGAIVCVIDNLELLEKSVSARKVIENLRDSLLTVHGIRWVFCGSLGIVTSILSSPRMEGFLHDPIELGGILSTHAKEAFQKRVDKFKVGEIYYLPITAKSFKELYVLLRKNMRNALKHANDYCLWIDDQQRERPVSNHEKETCFNDWLSTQSNRYKREMEDQLKPSSIALFQEIIKFEHNFGFSDYQLFGCENLQVMKIAVKELEIFGLLVSMIDENDQRRKSIQVTPKGWLSTYESYN